MVAKAKRGEAQPKQNQNLPHRMTSHHRFFGQILWTNYFLGMQGCKLKDTISFQDNQSASQKGMEQDPAANEPNI